MLQSCFAGCRKAKEREKNQRLSQGERKDNRESISERKEVRDMPRHSWPDKLGKGGHIQTTKRREVNVPSDRDYRDWDHRCSDEPQRTSFSRGGRQFVRGYGRTRGVRGASFGQRNAYGGRGSRGLRDGYNGRSFDHQRVQPLPDHITSKTEECDAVDEENEYGGRRRRGHDEESDVSVEYTSGYSESSSERVEVKEAASVSPGKDNTVDRVDQRKSADDEAAVDSTLQHRSQTSKQAARTNYDKEGDSRGDTVQRSRHRGDRYGARPLANQHGPRCNDEYRGSGGRGYRYYGGDSDRSFGQRVEHDSGSRKMSMNERHFVPRGEHSSRGRGE